MQQLNTYFGAFGPEWIWAGQVFAVVLVTAIVNYFIKRLLRRIRAQTRNTQTNWDNIVVQALVRPVGWVVWLLGLNVAVDIINAHNLNELFALYDHVRNLGVLLCLTWFVLGVIRGAEQEFSEKADQVDVLTIEALSKLVRLTVMITAALMILQTLGFSISGVLAMGGVGGIAVGFAAKDLLANFFGGLIVYLDRPFTIGDWIRSPDRKIEGTVEKIGWRVSVVRNFESQPMYIPNSVFTSIIVENPSRMANRRIYESIGLRYSDLTNMNQIVDEVKAMLMAHEEIDSEKTMMVNFNEFADSSVDFFIYSFTKTTQWVKFHQVKQDVMLKIAAIIENNQAEIAFPTSTLHLAEPVKVVS
ncbi:MAG: MscS family membrane protein [Planctomycetota bacterium]|jgi:MscS family membrane protein